MSEVWWFHYSNKLHEWFSLSVFFCCFVFLVGSWCCGRNVTTSRQMLLSLIWTGRWFRGKASLSRFRFASRKESRVIYPRPRVYSLPYNRSAFWMNYICNFNARCDEWWNWTDFCLYATRHFWGGMQIDTLELIGSTRLCNVQCDATVETRLR